MTDPRRLRRLDCGGSASHPYRLSTVSYDHRVINGRVSPFALLFISKLFALFRCKTISFSIDEICYSTADFISPSLLYGHTRRQNARNEIRKDISYIVGYTCKVSKLLQVLSVFDTLMTICNDRTL